MTVHVPLKVLPRLRAEGFDWLVPALRGELVTTLIRSLPKDARRALVPVPDVAAQVVAALKPRRGALVDAVAAELARLRGVRVTREDFDTGRLPAHLRMTFRVEDDDGALVAEGKDLEALRAAVRPRLRAQLAAASASLEAHGLRDWTIGEVPRVVRHRETGWLSTSRSATDLADGLAWAFEQPRDIIGHKCADSVAAFGRFAPFTLPPFPGPVYPTLGEMRHVYNFYVRPVEGR